MSFYFFKPRERKFAPDKIEEIRRSHFKNGISYRELAMIYHCDKNTIWDVCRNRNAYSSKKNWVKSDENF